MAHLSQTLKAIEKVLVEPSGVKQHITLALEFAQAQVSRPPNRVKIDFIEHFRYKPVSIAIYAIKYVLFVYPSIREFTKKNKKKQEKTREINNYQTSKLI